MSEPALSLTTRLWFAFACALRVLLDPHFAYRAWSVKNALPGKSASEAEAEAEADSESEAESESETGAGPTGALILLGILQREGRFVDFLEQDITSFDDADVGAAARVVHEGCRRALHAHGKVRPVRAEDEESRVEVARGLDTGEIKLTGKVAGKPPYRGLLRHRGWRIEALSLPTPIAGHDPSIVAAAEVEL